MITLSSLSMKNLLLNQISAEKLPTFLGIGSQRCASTWLNKILALHPKIVIKINIQNSSTSSNS